MNPQGLSLLAVLDESELGLRAASAGAALASRMGADLVLLVAIPIEHVEARSAVTAMAAQAQHQAQCRQRAADWFARAHALIQPFGVAVRTELTLEEEPSEAVLRVAAAHGCGLIVVGSQGRGAVARVLGGSLVADLVRLSPLPVLVVREDMPASAVAPAPAVTGA